MYLLQFVPISICALFGGIKFHENVAQHFLLHVWCMTTATLGLLKLNIYLLIFLKPEAELSRKLIF